VTTFATAVDRLINQVAHWEQPRWWSHLDAAGQTCGDAVHTLVQHLADLAADAESGPHRPVPRIGDMSLPDQLRVMADDLLAAAAATATAAAASDELLSRAAAEVDQTRQTL
jgi:hypothetical protein